MRQILLIHSLHICAEMKSPTSLQACLFGLLNWYLWGIAHATKHSTNSICYKLEGEEIADYNLYNFLLDANSW